MRKLVYSINLTVDGCCDHRKQFVDDEMLANATELVRGTDLFLYGRKTYELMVPYWPEVLKGTDESPADVAFARAFVAAKKVVFSRTLESVEDSSARVVRGDLREEVLKLKQGDGPDILVGGVDLPTQLVELGLIDEFRILVGPVVAGEGRRLFDGLPLAEPVKLELVESTVLKSGCVVLRYATK